MVSPGRRICRGRPWLFLVLVICGNECPPPIPSLGGDSLIPDPYLSFSSPSSLSGGKMYLLHGEKGGKRSASFFPLLPGVIKLFVKSRSSSAQVRFISTLRKLGGCEELGIARKTFPIPPPPPPTTTTAARAANKKKFLCPPQSLFLPTDRQTEFMQIGIDFGGTSFSSLQTFFELTFLFTFWGFLDWASYNAAKSLACFLVILHCCICLTYIVIVPRVSKLPANPHFFPPHLSSPLEKY